MDYEGAKTAAAHAGQLNTHAECERDVQSDLEAIHARLQNLTGIAECACATLNEFLNRCGRALPPGNNGAKPNDPAVADGHFSRIAEQFEGLGARLSFITSAADRIAKIG